MKKIIGKAVLNVLGWKSNYPKEFQVEKFVIIAAPHTSNWDLVFALAVFWKMDKPMKYFIKDSFTKPPHGWFFKMMGAIGVDRKKTGNLVHHAAATITKEKHIALMVPAEGTRTKVKKWKTGFYHIAKKANVPVALGYLDYKNKIAGVGGLVYLTDSFENDMQIIEDFYKNIDGKHPEKYNKKIF
ncbi:MAG TPA: glycerol acyltransferase [Lutibacter sp.]|nr:glycerol acyltransferase [Lutibacter sp.]